MVNVPKFCAVGKNERTFSPLRRNSKSSGSLFEAFQVGRNLKTPPPAALPGSLIRDLANCRGTDKFLAFPSKFPLGNHNVKVLEMAMLGTQTILVASLGSGEAWFCLDAPEHPSESSSD